MTIKELIEQLSKFDQNKNVCVISRQVYDDGSGSIEYDDDWAILDKITEYTGCVLLEKKDD